MSFFEKSLEELVRWTPNGSGNEELRSRALAELRRQVAATEQNNDSVHLTVTAVVTTRERTRTLLIRHRTTGRWQPPGGHCEPGDDSLCAAAHREAVEETGVRGLAHVGLLTVRPGVEGCHPNASFHLDAVFQFHVDEQIDPAPSEEVAGCGWFALDSLPSPMAIDTRGILDGLRA